MSMPSAALEKKILLEEPGSPYGISLVCLGNTKEDLLSYCTNDNVEALKEKLAIYDMDINAPITSYTGKTMLMYAVQSKSKKVLKFLLSQPKIDVLRADYQDKTALDCMIEDCMIEGGDIDFDIARDLMKHGDKIDKVKHNDYLRIKIRSLTVPSRDFTDHLIDLGAQLDYINEEPSLRIARKKLDKEGIKSCRNVGAIIEKNTKTRLLMAWEKCDQKVAKKLIQLGANIEFSEALYKAELDYSNHPIHAVIFGSTSCCQRLSGEPELPRNPKFKMDEQIELSKQFFQEIEKAKWMGVAVAYICFQKQIEISLLEGFLVHKKTPAAKKTEEENNDAVREAYNLGYAMMRNRLIKEQYDSCSFFSKEPVPPTLLFTAQVEQRERELANEICWQQWQNNYYANFPNRKDQRGYGPGAVVAVSSRKLTC